MTRPLEQLEGKQQNPLSPEDQLTCIDDGQGKFVHKYFNGVLDELAKGRFEEHLVLCFYCQDRVLKLDAIFKVLGEEKETFFP
jgi:hypothetical protein